MAFGAKIDADAVSIEGIETITLADLAAADELGYRIKLLGVAERTPKGIEQRVHPTMVAKSEPLAQTMGVLNAVTIDGDAVGALTLVGAGAGGDPTASAVAADIVDIARGDYGPAFGRPVEALEDAERVPMQRHEGGYYVRLAVVDRPGSMASIATRMGERKISLEAIMQKRPAKGAPSSDIAPVVLITHATTEASIREALALARRRRGGEGKAAGHPHRAGLERVEQGEHAHQRDDDDAERDFGEAGPHQDAQRGRVRLEARRQDVAVDERDARSSSPPARSSRTAARGTASSAETAARRWSGRR